MDVLTINEASVELKISPRLTMQLLKSGALPGALIGRRWRLDRTAIADMLRQQHGQIAREPAHATRKPKR